jgi:hypothetical protein
MNTFPPPRACATASGTSPVVQPVPIANVTDETSTASTNSTDAEVGMVSGINSPPCQNPCQRTVICKPPYEGKGESFDKAMKNFDGIDGSNVDSDWEPSGTMADPDPGWTDRATCTNHYLPQLQIANTIPNEGDRLELQDREQLYDDHSRSLTFHKKLRKDYDLSNC